MKSKKLWSLLKEFKWRIFNQIGKTNFLRAYNTEFEFFMIDKDISVYMELSRLFINKTLPWCKMLFVYF